MDRHAAMIRIAAGETELEEVTGRIRARTER
jgi:hypothetical protein